METAQSTIGSILVKVRLFIFILE